MVINWLSANILINVIFGLLILYAFATGWKNKSKNTKPRLTSALPGICVSLGVLGTFTGIFLGLYHFNEQELSKSIPLLLGGMKTAFLTSLGGMGASIVLNCHYACSEDQQKSSANPIESLQRIEEAIVSCFKSDEEYSLVSQVKLIRQELIDGRRETKKVFEEFADQFSKMASESLVTELQHVVDNFNGMLNDLVSESFKELTESTIRLNEWQHEYKQTIVYNQDSLKETVSQVQKTHTVFNDALAQLAEFNNQISNVEKALASISTSGSELDDHTKALASQNTLLEASIKSVQEIGNDAKAVIPEIAGKLGEIVSDIEAMQKQTITFVSNTTQVLHDGVEKVTGTLATQSTELQEKTNSFVDKTTKELSNNYEQLSVKTQEHVRSIEESLEKELTNSLNSLAGSLASLSEKFVSDYTPLTDKLRTVVRIAEQADVRAAS